jgi:hypothetical protein
MPARKSAADVTLAAGLPDQPRNGLARLPKEFRAHKRIAKSVYVTAELTRKGLELVDESGVWVSKMQVASIYIHDDQEFLEKLHREVEEQQTGEGQIPYADGQAERRAGLEQMVLAWAQEFGRDPREEWEAYFGAEVPAGPRGAELHHLIEFADHHGITSDGEAASEREDHDTAEDDDEAPTDQAGIAADEDTARHKAAAVPAFTEQPDGWGED